MQFNRYSVCAKPTREFPVKCVDCLLPPFVRDAYIGFLRSAGIQFLLKLIPLEYAINENFGFTMRRYFDEETNEWVDKALVVVDGKVLNPTGFYKIVKGS